VTNGQDVSMTSAKDFSTQAWPESRVSLRHPQQPQRSLTKSMGNVENVVFLSLVLDLFGNLLDPCPVLQSPTRICSIYYSPPALSASY
jgi:hypothetical protein